MSENWKICNNQNPKVSILVTFCNQKDFIKDALDSCLNQRVDFEYEILIGLDNGDIESRKIIQEYIEKYSNIKLFEIDNSNLNITNIEKASRNRLNLLKRAKGEYINFLDGDDFFCDENRLQILADFLDENPNYIGVFHDLIYFCNKTKKFLKTGFLEKNEKEYSANDFIKIHMQFSCFLFRNIFYSKVPNDLNCDFVNDSSVIYYYLRYGKFYYIPKHMVGYRINTETIFYSQAKEIRLIYQLLCVEVNHNILPIYEKRQCKHKRFVLKACFENREKIAKIDKNELEKIRNAALKQGCYFTRCIIDYKKLNFFEKIAFHFNKFLYIKLKINLKSNKSSNRSLTYFKERANFGDELNLYILQRIFDLNIKYEKVTKADLIAIGSFLQVNLKKKKDFNFKSIKIFSTGLIQEYEKPKFHRKMKILALRGKHTQKQVENILKRKINVTLADGGLLASKLLDLSKIEKKYKVGIIPHYVDFKFDLSKNVGLENYRVIDVTKNPMFVLSEIAQCEVILSSSLHGLIIADSFNIPNKWVKMSDNLFGGDYKFRDYYSIYDYEPKAIDLRDEIVDEKTIETIKKEYEKLNFKEKIEKAQEELLEAGKNI